jgi:membrane-bound lytic murein transglycosylase D
MILPHKKHLVLLSLIFVSSLISACSGFKTSISPSSPAIKPISSPESLAGNADAVSTQNEPEIYLQQELEALSQTGNWVEAEHPDTGLKYKMTVQSDFPVIINKQVEMYIDFFQNEHRKLFANWLTRSKQYLPMMQQELKSAGLPLDLAYLAMIESGFNQRACSTAQAVGIWQFMSETGKQYDLRIDNYVDERRDAEKATKAAVAMLGDLYNDFGDWNLAVAAYNAGPGKISAGLKKYNVNTFWELAKEQHLALETIRYVPQLMAAIIIAKDPERYGFSDIRNTSPPSYDTLVVGPGMTFDGLALISNTSKEELQALNLELISGKTPLTDSKYQVKIPAGTRNIALNNLPRLRTVVTTDYKTHIVGHHETLGTISKKYDVNHIALLKANNLKNNKFIAGQHVRIPFNTVHYQLAPERIETTIAHASNTKVQRANNHSGEAIIARSDVGNKIQHTIRSGETVTQISKQYKVQPEMILAWNDLKDTKKLRIGQQITIQLPDERHRTPDKTIADKPVQTRPVIVADSKKKPAESKAVLTAQKKDVHIQTIKEEYKSYRIESGDSLWTIAQKFKTSPDQIKDWNNLKSNALRPGDKLKVKETLPIIAERIKKTVF